MIIINGKLCDEGKINFDEGLSFGRGLFETILVQKAPIFLMEHLQRLKDGLKVIGISTNITEEYIRENIIKLECENCSVKVIVTSKNIIFIKRHLNYSEKQYANGFSLLVGESKRNKYSKLTYLKSTNYLENILERERILKAGYDEALFLNTDDEICEGSLTNIFFIVDDKIYTPAIDCGILKGIVRSYIINKYNVIEGKYYLEDLYKSQGIFITNSLIGIMKVAQINNKSINETAIIEKIRNDYDNYLATI